MELVCVIGSGLNHPIGLVQFSEAAEKEKEDIRLSLKSTLDQLNQSLESHQVLGAIMIIKDHGVLKMIV